MSSLQRLHLLCVPSKAIYLGYLFQKSLVVTPYSSLSSNEDATNVTLTEEELTKINLLIPCLCESNQLATAVCLTTTALLANPPLKSLSMSVFIDSLASQTDMTQAMSVLTRLKYNQRSHPYIRPITIMLVTTYFNNYKYKEALKVFNWMERPDSPCFPDEKIYRILINGFFRKGFVLEGLKVLRAMVGANMEPSCDSKDLVYRGLLRQARIKEAMALNDALSCADTEGLKRISLLLERMIAEWTD